MEKSTQNMRSTLEHDFFISHIVERPYMYFKYFSATFHILLKAPNKNSCLEMLHSADFYLGILVFTTSIILHFFSVAAATSIR